MFNNQLFSTTRIYDLAAEFTVLYKIPSFIKLGTTMKSIVCLYLTSILVIFAYAQHTCAQDYTKWHLPDGAKARFGKANIIKIAYSHDGTRLAVAS